MDKSKKIGLAIIGLLPLVLLARGVYVLVTGEYHGQPRYGDPIHLTGFEAYMTGSGLICLAFMLSFALSLEFGMDKRLAGLGSGVFLVGAIVSFWLSFWK